jgi:hypothetical protein
LETFIITLDLYYKIYYNIIIEIFKRSNKMAETNSEKLAKMEQSLQKNSNTKKVQAFNLKAANADLIINAAKALNLSKSGIIDVLIESNAAELTALIEKNKTEPEEILE